MNFQNAFNKKDMDRGVLQHKNIQNIEKEKTNIK